MKLFKWTVERDQYLRDHWLKERVIDIAAHFNVSKHVIMRRARKLGIEKKPVDRRQPHHFNWTEAMDEYLKDNYQSSSNQELASYLNISVQGIMRRMKKLDLSRGRDGHTHFDWKDKDVLRLTTLFSDGIYIHDIADQFGVSKQTIKRKLKTLGLKRLRKKRK